MRRATSLLVVVLLASIGTAADSAGPGKQTAIERGRDLVRGTPPLNPALWTMRAYENAWKKWGLKQKPADYDRLFRERYGLVEAPYDNHGLPMGLSVSMGLLGKGVVNDCMLCHSGRIAGQTIVGLANTSVDVQGLFSDLFASDGFIRIPEVASHMRGTIDPISPVALLLQLRDPELRLGRRPRLPVGRNGASDPPAWWLLKRKKTRDWMGQIDANSTRVDLVNLLSPFNSSAYIRDRQPAFADIHQFILNLQPPRYPFPIDRTRAERGQVIFKDTCARCHGTYGPGATYPNKIVPLKTIGTDPILARSLSPVLVDFFNQSWLAREIGQDGKPIQLQHHEGYQAPPLDGIWATAPYFHNGSAPTVYHVLNAQARPKFFTRSYRAEREDYDPVKLGWKITELTLPRDGSLPGNERRRIYDTTLPGLANTGHTFGDDLTEEQRMAVIEYLKTL